MRINPQDITSEWTKPPEWYMIAGKPRKRAYSYWKRISVTASPTRPLACVYRFRRWSWSCSRLLRLNTHMQWSSIVCTTNTYFLARNVAEPRTPVNQQNALVRWRSQVPWVKLVHFDAMPVPMIWPQGWVMRCPLGRRPWPGRKKTTDEINKVSHFCIKLLQPSFSWVALIYFLSHTSLKMFSIPDTTSYKYRFPERHPFFPCHTLTCKMFSFPDCRACSGAWNKGLQRLPHERRLVKHVETCLIFFLFHLRSIIIPAEQSLAAHHSARSAEQHRAAPCPAVPCRAVRPCPAVRCGTVPCCVVLRAVVYLLFRTHQVSFDEVVHHVQQYRGTSHQVCTSVLLLVLFTLLLSSFWTGRGHRCRPFSPPVFAFNFYRA